MKIQNILKTKPLKGYSKSYRFKKQTTVPAVPKSPYGLGGFLGGYGYGRNNDDRDKDENEGMETVDTDSGGDSGGGDGGGGGGE